MATEYAPLFLDADQITRVTSAAVTAGQLLMVSGDDTVAKTSGAVSSWLGVAAFDAASGASVTVYTVGVHILAASGAITAGDLVIPAANGAVQTIGSLTATVDSQIVGVALSAAASNLVTVLIR